MNIPIFNLLFISITLLPDVIQPDTANKDPLIEVIKLIKYMGKDIIQLKKQVEASSIRLLLAELRMKKSQMQVRNLTHDMGATKLAMKTDEEQSSKIHKDLQGGMVGVKKQLSEHMETISQIKEDQEIYKKRMFNLSEKLFINEKIVKSVNKNVSRLQEDAATLGGRITSLEEEAAKNKENISTVKEIQELHAERIRHIEENVDTNNDEIAKIYKDFKDLFGVKEKLDEVNDFMNQIHIYIQYKSPRYKDKLKYSFSQIIKLIGKEDKISKNVSILQHLSEQNIEFEEEYKYKWGIEYSDVVRLSEGLVFNDSRPLSILKKIDYMYDQFTEFYRTKWGIDFTDVVALTENLYFNVGDMLPVLIKLDYVYERFNESYRAKWGIEFKDVVDLTENLDFNVGDEVPVFRKISSWYVDGFQEIWGDSFKDFLAIMKDHPSKRTSILKKVSDVADKEKFLKFLPAKFVYANEELSVYGYIEVFLSNIWGTIWNSKRHFGGDSSAEVLCRQAGYNQDKGVYGNGIYNTGTVDRTSMNCLVSQLLCYGEEQNVTMCNLRYDVKGTAWDHREDVGIKCTF